MKITHYLYNTFLIEENDKKIVIDPGGLFLYYLRTTTLILKSEWKGITHLLITHGDPDHYWHADRVAAVSGAAVVCNKTMLRNVDGRNLMLGPRSKGLKFNTPIKNINTLSVDETITVNGLTITGLKTTHGKLMIKQGPLSKTIAPGPEERIGWGAIVEPDVLMIPIGGSIARNTMDEDDALQAVSVMRPTTVIPCHYNCPGLFTRRLNSADDQYFKSEVEKLGAKCLILGKGESIEI